MQGPLVSIVMPAFNASATISGAVLGVVNQRYGNWELLIIDDGSTDDMEHEVKQFNDRRIRYLRLSRNGGLAAALNIGIMQAQGRYIARMDADDYMEEWRLGDQVRQIMLHNLAVCGTGAEKFGDETGRITNPVLGTQIIDSFLTGNPFVHPTVMFDRERVGRELRYDSGFRCEEDYELWARLLTRHNCGNLDYPCIRYRITAGGNANHPQKKKLNRFVIELFCKRFGIADIAPIAEISEFQMSGYVDEPGYRKFAEYVTIAEQRGLPKLGWLHGAVLEHGTFAAFFAWLNEVQRFSSYRYSDT
jgi:glycosyltransferase involved in cell wall biosynthesis